MKQRFEFSVSGDTLIGDLYVPPEPPKGLVVTTGPLTSVKEQATGAYAAALAQHGFCALSFDHRHFGESGGAPRQYENPDQKIADIHAAAEALEQAYPGCPVFALGVCAGAEYMAGAVAQEPRFKAYVGIAGFYHDAAQSKEWMGDGFETAIAEGRAAREAYEREGAATMIPAVALDGDRAMPMDEAYAFYGTPRGGAATFANYKNAFAVMSREKTTPYDAQQAAAKIKAPSLLIHSENALVPMLARRFFDSLAAPKSDIWMSSQGQIDFYDDPALIGPAVEAVANHFSDHV